MSTRSRNAKAELKQVAIRLELNCPPPPGFDLEEWLIDQIQLLERLNAPLENKVHQLEMRYAELLLGFAIGEDLTSDHYG